MKIPSFVVSSLVAGAVLLGAAGCSTTASRISAHDAAFAQWPAPVQQKVRAGQIDIGFTQEQVRVALGNPERSFTQTTSAGTIEVWTYRIERSHFSFGVGVGSSSRGSAVGGGIAVSDRGRGDGSTRVIFDTKGTVAQIDAARR